MIYAFTSALTHRLFTLALPLSLSDCLHLHFHSNSQANLILHTCRVAHFHVHTCIVTLYWYCMTKELQDKRITRKHLI